jgi:hypothetical protein
MHQRSKVGVAITTRVDVDSALEAIEELGVPESVGVEPLTIEISTQSPYH